MVSTIRAPKDAMSITTLNDIFFAAVERNLDRMLLYREAGKWLPITSRDFGRSVARTARALHAWGIRPGDRIAILSENRPEWPMADIASLLLGAVTVPLYTTLTAEQTAFVLNDSACRTIFLSSDQQLHKILSILPQTQIEKIVVMDPVEFNGDLAPFAGKCVTMNQITLQGPEDLGPEIEAKARSIGPQDLATIVYTSGTTGTSKGAMLTHGNIASNIQCSLLGFNMRPGLISISFLPLCHITARHVDFAMLYHGVTLAYCPFLDRLPASLMEVQPSVFVAVPRVYEKIYAQAAQKAKDNPNAPSSNGPSLSESTTNLKFLREGLRHRVVGSWPTSSSFPRFDKAWAARSRPLSLVERRLDANWPSGTPTPASAFTKATGLRKPRPSLP